MRKMRTTTSLVSAVMVLVLTVLALSTATYAWFSADNVVNLSTISFEVSNDTRGEGDLRVLWDFDGGGNAPVDREDIYTPEGLAALEGKTSLDARAKSLELNQWGGFEVVEPEYDWDRALLAPSMPSVAPRKGMLASEFLESLYSSNTSYRIEEGKIVEYYYSEPTQKNVAALVSRGNIEYAHRGNFFVYNVNEAFGQKVTLSFNIGSTNEIIQALKCAVFVNNGLVGIMGATSRIYYGPIVKGANIEDNLNYVTGDLSYDSANPEGSTGPAPGDTSTTGIIVSPFTIEVYDMVNVKLYFYLDGNYVTNQKTGGYSFDVADFKLTGEYIEKPIADNVTP